MSSDLLQRFRGGSPSDKVLSGPARVTYQAFRRSDARIQRLKVRPRARAWERMHYGYLQRIVEDSIYGTQLGLVFTFAVVILQGRNLQAVAEAIDAEQCEFVQQFDPSRWEEPSDPKAPFIESIEIHVQTKVEAADALVTRAQPERDARQPGAAPA